ncbi:MAG: thioredoxin family protein [Actinomycetota bacterium]
MGSVTEATRESFNELISEGVVLVDVWGPDCRPCVALHPHVERIAEENPHLSVVKLEAPKARRICIEHKVMGMPAFLLFRDGKEVARISESNLSPQTLRSWISEHAAPLLGASGEPAESSA